MKRNGLFSMLNRKAADKKGETLVETLTALLIVALALIILAGTVSSASRIIHESRENMNSYYEQNNRLEEQRSDDADFSGTAVIRSGAAAVQLMPGGKMQSELDFFVNGSAKIPVISYKLK